MAADSAAWLCPICEGVNHGSGRVCTTCGERLPDGFVPRSATRHAVRPAAPPAVVPVPRRPRPPTFDDIFGPY